MPAFFATAPRGLEDLVAAELQGLGIADAAAKRSGAHFTGSFETAYQVCLWSRVANRVLFPIATLPAGDPDQLYAAAHEGIDWSAHLDASRTLEVVFNSTRSEVRHTQYGAQVVKDGIVDQIREKTGRRPSVDLETPDVSVNVYVRENQAQFAIDLAGTPLQRRAYRSVPTDAPLKENVAAAILLRAGWPEAAAAGQPLVDPMCGSGTFLIEAAMIAGDIAPGLLRNYFGFQGWLQFRPEAWESLRTDALRRAHDGRKKLPPLMGFDIDRKAIRATELNLIAAGLDGAAELKVAPIEEVAPTDGIGPGVVVTNPPYGVRLEKKRRRKLVRTYEHLGARLKEKFGGWTAFVLTADEDLGKATGLRATKRHVFFNGTLRCQLLHLPISDEPAPAKPEVAGLDDFVNRLQKNQKRLGKWAKKNDVSCYRLYDSDVPEFGLAIDLYGPRVLVQEFEAPEGVHPGKARRRVKAVRAALPDLLGVSPDDIFYRVRKRQKKGDQYERLDESGERFTVHEGGLRFKVNLSDYLDTGLFLDHRPTRGLIRKLAKGKRFLNLFGYTGSATVYAADGGAKKTTTVDLSNTYLDWALENMELNHLRDPKHRFVKADALTWLKQEKDRWDLIFLDPPTFSRSKAMEDSFDVQRDHVALIEAAMKRLTKKGTLLFSTNRRKFRLDKKALKAFEIEDITAETIPKDFAKGRKPHRCFRFRSAKG